MKRFIKRIIIALIIVLLLQISLFGQTSMLKSVEAAVSGPFIVGMSPTDDSTSTAINSALSITFDEAVMKGSSSVVITIYNDSKNSVFESFPVTSSNVVISGGAVTIIPSKLFENNTEYYVLIESGSFSNVSNGAVFSGITDSIRWNFKTIEATGAAPTGTISINNGATILQVLI